MIAERAISSVKTYDLLEQSPEAFSLILSQKTMFKLKYYKGRNATAISLQRH